MPSTTSLIAGLEMMATGENDETWGPKTNNNLQLLEALVTNVSSITVADSGTTTISLTNFTRGNLHNIGYKLTGTLTDVRTVELPAKPKLFAIHNATSGGFAVNVRITGGTSISVANGAKALFMSDGSSLVAIANDALGGASSLSIAGESITSGTVPIARLPVASSGSSSTSLIVRSDDSRLSNDRTPSDASVTLAKMASSVPASESDATTGSNNTRFMTALRTWQAIDGALGYSDAYYTNASIPSTSSSALHGRATTPIHHQFTLRCQTDDIGYTASNSPVFDFSATKDLGAFNNGLVGYFDLTRYYIFKLTGGSVYLPHASTRAPTAIDTTKWIIDVRAWF
jgi:hypothetical protein